MIGRHHVEKRLAQLRIALRRQGLKATRQRAEILRELASTGEHPDAETIHGRVRRRIPAISLDTVYRTLRMFEERGVIARVVALGDRARFDADTGRHHHFVCVRCGRVADLPSGVFDSFRLPPEVVAADSLDGARIEVRGVCARCGPRRRGTA